MTRRSGDVSRSDVSGQVAIGDRNVQHQQSIEASLADPPGRPWWKIIGAATAIISAVAAVIALFAH